eukprot:jgi/Psemu1/25048/gm1.25048_g
MSEDDMFKETKGNMHKINHGRLKNDVNRKSIKYALFSNHLQVTPEGLLLDEVSTTSREASLKALMYHKIKMDSKGENRLQVIYIVKFIFNNIKELQPNQDCQDKIILNDTESAKFILDYDKIAYKELIKDINKLNAGTHPVTKWQEGTCFNCGFEAQVKDGPKEKDQERIGHHRSLLLGGLKAAGVAAFERLLSLSMSLHHGSCDQLNNTTLLPTRTFNVILDLSQPSPDSSLGTDDAGCEKDPLAFAIQRKRKQRKKHAMKTTKKLFPSLSKFMVKRSNKLIKGHLCLNRHLAVKASRRAQELVKQIDPGYARNIKVMRDLTADPPGASNPIEDRGSRPP